MAFIFNATPGASDANSYATVEYAVDYWLSSPGAAADAWAGYDETLQQGLLVKATRVIDMLATPGRLFVPDKPPYYRVRPQWTGSPATATQALAWARVGMYNRNGVAIDPATIPNELKDAVSEFAGQLGLNDSTTDNSALAQGITSIKAGSVSLSFSDLTMASITKMLPDSVLFLMPPSWFTDETIVGGRRIVFEANP